MSTVIVLAFIQAFFLSVLLLSKKNKHISDMILSVWLLSLGLHLLINYLSVEFQMQNSWVININSGYAFLQGAFLFLYVNALTHHRINFLKTYAIHFSPFVIYVVYQIILLWGSVSEANEVVNVHIFEMSDITNVFLIGSVPFYSVWSLVVLKNYKTRLKNVFSRIDQKNQDWLHHLIISLMVVWIIVIFVFLQIRFGGVSQFSGVRHLVFIGLTLFVYAVGYFGLKRTSIFSENLSTELIDEVKSDSKYEHSKINDDERNRAKTILNRIMKEEKVYLDSELTLPILAEKLDLSTHHTSQLLNDSYKQSFYDYVNSFRVEHVIQLMKSPESKNVTLLSIALDSGFGSKASFNRIFKQFKNLTPSQFLRENQS